MNSRYKWNTSFKMWNTYKQIGRKPLVNRAQNENLLKNKK